MSAKPKMTRTVSKKTATGTDWLKHCRISYSDEAKELLAIKDSDDEKETTNIIATAIDAVSAPKKRTIVIKRKTEAEKKQFIMQHARKNMLPPHDILNLIQFVKLNYSDINTICNWTERYWIQFGDLREWEYFCNRDACDVPESIRTETDNYEDYGEYRDVITIEMFNKYNKIPEFKYDLYVAMSKCINS